MASLALRRGPVSRNASCRCILPPPPGVYLKSNPEAVANLGLPSADHDLGLRFVETQLAAVPDDPGESPVLMRC